MKTSPEVPPVGEPAPEVPGSRATGNDAVVPGLSWWRCTLLFALVGPLLAALFVVAVGGALAVIAYGEKGLGTGLVLLIFGIPVGYVAGFVPAAVAGVTFSLLANAWRSTFRRVGPLSGRARIGLGLVCGLVGFGVHAYFRHPWAFETVTAPASLLSATTMAYVAGNHWWLRQGADFLGGEGSKT